MQLALVVFAVLIGLCLSVPAFPEPEFDEPEEDTQIEERHWGNHPWIKRRLRELQAGQNKLKGKLQDMMANLTAQIMELRKNLKNQEENNAQVKQQLEKQTKDLEGRFNNGNETCITKYTAWIKGPYVGHLVYHNVKCPQNYYLSSFKLDNANQRNRYVYQCCKIIY